MFTKLFSIISIVAAVVSFSTTDIQVSSESSAVVSSCSLSRTVASRTTVAATKSDCDRAYSFQISLCQCRCKTKYQKNLCYRKAMEAYARCLANARNGGVGGGSFGGRNILVDLEVDRIGYSQSLIRV